MADAMHGHTRPSAAKGRGAAAGSMEAAQSMRASLWRCPLARPQSPWRRPALLFCRLLSWQVPGPSPVRLGACCSAGVPQPSPRVQRGVPQLLQPPCATRDPTGPSPREPAGRAAHSGWLGSVATCGAPPGRLIRCPHSSSRPKRPWHCSGCLQGSPTPSEAVCMHENDSTPALAHAPQHQNPVMHTVAPRRTVLEAAVAATDVLTLTPCVSHTRHLGFTQVFW